MITARQEDREQREDGFNMVVRTEVMHAPTDAERERNMRRSRCKDLNPVTDGVTEVGRVLVTPPLMG